MDFSEWVRTTVNPLSVQLDDENPRIAGQGLEQSQIRRLLVEHENVTELAHKISQTGGVFPHDLMIVGNFKGATVVLEGNRRIAALQMLLNPSLIPEESKDKFPRADDELKSKVNRIPALLAPDRPSADYLIAQIHAFPRGRRGHH